MNLIEDTMDSDNMAYYELVLCFISKHVLGAQRNISFKLLNISFDKISKYPFLNDLLFND